jgi:cytoskeletal protein CcmA (bactofilin family)
MGATYTRQSTITDGAVIEASHFNDEFDQLLAFAASSTGHTHDGTSAEGGPITKLLGNTLTFGAGTAGTDIAITFDGETSDGVLKWMEDEDYFEFSDDILVASTEKLQFRDTAIYINSSTDGQLDLVADTEIQIAATTVDINGNVDVSGTLTVAGAVDFGDAALSNVGAVQLDSIAGDGDTNTSITFSGSDVITITAGGDAQFTFNNGSILPSTDDDIDLGSSSYEFKDAYFDGTVTTDALVADTANIDGGSIDGATIGTNSAITQAVIDNINIDGATIGHTSDTDLLTLASGVLTVAGEVSMTTLDIGGTNVTSTAAELNILDGVTATATEINALDGITSTVSELNILDGDNSASSVTIVDADQIILNDGGTMKQVAVTALNTYTSSSIAADNISTGDAAVTLATSAGNITIDAQGSDTDIIFKGTDGASDITALTLDMSAAGAATFNDKIIATELDISGDVDIDGTLEADAITIDGTTLAETISDTVGAMVGSNTETGISVTYEDGDNTLDFVLGSSQTAISSLTNTSLVIGRDADNDIDFATDNTILFRADGADQIKLINGALAPVTDDDIDLGTSSLEFKDGYFDGTVTADAFAGPLTGDVTGNVSGTAATVTGAAQSNITSLGTLTTLTVDNVIVNGTTIGHTDDNDLITLADGIATVAGEISVTTLDIGGTNVAATAAELNIMDGGTAASSITLADADRLVTNDDGTMKQVALTTLKTYLTSAGFSTEDPTALAIALG